MSSNPDVIRNLYRAFAVSDIPAVLAALSPDVRWTEAEGGPYGGVSIGPNAVLENVFMKLGGGKVASFHQHTDTAVHLRPMQP